MDPLTMHEPIIMRQSSLDFTYQSVWAYIGQQISVDLSLKLIRDTNLTQTNTIIIISKSIEEAQVMVQNATDALYKN